MRFVFAVVAGLSFWGAVALDPYCLAIGTVASFAALDEIIG